MKAQVNNNVNNNVNVVSSNQQKEVSKMEKVTKTQINADHAVALKMNEAMDLLKSYGYSVAQPKAASTTSTSNNFGNKVECGAKRLDKVDAKSGNYGKLTDALRAFGFNVEGDWRTARRLMLKSGSATLTRVDAKTGEKITVEFCGQ